MLTQRTVAIRHAQHIPSPDDPFNPLTGLTLFGYQEASLLGASMSDLAFTSAVAFNSQRAITTTRLVLESSNSGNVPITLDDSMGYIEPPAGAFSDRLLETYQLNQQFPFTVYESDNYAEHFFPISCFSIMAGAAAMQVAHKRKETDNSRLVCSREFIFPSLIAKVLHLNESDLSRDKYVKWYMENVEGTERARLTKTSIETKSDGSVAIRDTYGEIHTDILTLEAIINAMSNMNARYE